MEKASTQEEVDIPVTARREQQRLLRETIMQDPRWEFCFFPNGGNMNKLRQEQVQLKELLLSHIPAYFQAEDKKSYILNTIIPQQKHWYMYEHTTNGFVEPAAEVVAEKIRDKMRNLKKSCKDLITTASAQRRSDRNSDVPWSEEALQSAESVTSIAERISLRTMVECLSETVEKQHAELEVYRQTKKAKVDESELLQSWSDAAMSDADRTTGTRSSVATSYSSWWQDIVDEGF